MAAALPRLAARGNAELCFGDLEGERLEVEIAAVRKDDDGHAVRREALDDRPEAHRLAVVPGALVSLPRVQEPAEAVRDRAAREDVVAALLPLGPERLGPIQALWFLALVRSAEVRPIGAAQR